MSYQIEMEIGQGAQRRWDWRQNLTTGNGSKRMFELIILCAIGLNAKRGALMVHLNRLNKLVARCVEWQ